MRQARTIYEEGESFALAMYCGGLAVECLLRAFRWKEDKSFEGRHDLTDLLRASGLMKVDDAYMRRKSASEEEISESSQMLRRAMNEVVVLGHNNLRYSSEDSLKAFLRKIDRFHGIKGNPLKKNASDLLEAAQTVLDRGVALWTSKRRSRER
jgi:hypothetical protein